MTPLSVTGKLRFAWPWSGLQRAQLLVTLAPDSLAVPTVAGAPSHSAKQLTETSLRMSQLKTNVPEEVPRTTSKSGFKEDIVDEKGIEERRKHKNEFVNKQCVNRSKNLEE